jgi:hypothetical protein
VFRDPQEPPVPRERLAQRVIRARPVSREPRALRARWAFKAPSGTLVPRGQQGHRACLVPRVTRAQWVLLGRTDHQDSRVREDLKESLARPGRWDCPVRLVRRERRALPVHQEARETQDP